jgi:hypothetical protein
MWLRWPASEVRAGLAFDRRVDYQSGPVIAVAGETIQTNQSMDCLVATVGSDAPSIANLSYAIRLRVKAAWDDVR